MDKGTFITLIRIPMCKSESALSRTAREKAKSEEMGLPEATCTEGVFRGLRTLSLQDVPPPLREKVLLPRGE